MSGCRQGGREDSEKGGWAKAARNGAKRDMQQRENSLSDICAYAFTRRHSVLPFSTDTDPVQQRRKKCSREKMSGDFLPRGIKSPIHNLQGHLQALRPPFPPSFGETKGSLLVFSLTFLLFTSVFLFLVAQTGRCNSRQWVPTDWTHADRVLHSKAYP